MDTSLRTDDRPASRTTAAAMSRQVMRQVRSVTPLPELAAALRDRAEPILADWAREVNDALPRADALTLTQLRNSLPPLLSEMADVLETGNLFEARQYVRQAPMHGESRFGESYALDELIFEFELLRPIALRQLGGALGRDLILDEVVTFGRMLDVAVRASATRFADQQREQIEAKTESLERFLQFVSHDVRNQLNGALMSIQMLSAEARDDPNLTHLADDLDDARRMVGGTVSTMTKLLTVEQLRGGEVEVARGPIRLADLLQQLCRSGDLADRRQSGDEAINAIRIECDADLIVHADRGLLSTVFQNLLGNAIKYGGDKPVLVQASCDDAGCQVEVIDEGPGIAAEKQGKLFDAFSRAGATGPDGVGLGLTIARLAAEHLGGSLALDSAPGRGSRFILTLPRPPRG